MVYGTAVTPALTNEEMVSWTGFWQVEEEEQERAMKEAEDRAKGGF